MNRKPRQPPIVTDTTINRQRDIDAIKSVISDIETGFNTNDADLSVAHFAQNSSAVDVAGRLISGRDALLAAMRADLAGPFRDQHARYQLTDVVFLRADVAVAHKRAQATTGEGDLLDVGHTMIALYVLVKEGVCWRVAARQCTVQK